MSYMLLIVEPPGPAVDGGHGEIEVRRMFELEDFTPGDAVEKFREIGVGRAPAR